MPAVGRLIGTPASISASEEPQTVAIDEEPFELGDLRNDADRVGEFRGRRQHGMDRAPGELAMADLASSGRTHAARLADRIGREVIVQQEALLVGAFQGVDELLVFAGAERRDHQRLGLAAGEQRRAVGARQHADLAENRADRGQVAPVDAPAVVEDVPAHHLGLQVVEGLGDLFGGELCLALGRDERGHDFFADGVHRRVALLLLGDRIGGAEVRLGDLQHRLLDLGMIGNDELARLARRLLGEADDGVDDRLEPRVARHHRLQHGVFGKLLGLRFDHQHCVLSAGDDEIERGILHLLERRIDLDLVLDVADARRADRAHEGNARKRQSRRGRDQRQDARIVLQVMAEHRGDHLRIAAEPVGE